MLSQAKEFPELWDSFRSECIWMFLYFTLLWLKIDLKTSLALQFYFAANIQTSESLHREVIFKHDL